MNNRDRPIFFAITRSFWFGWFPALLTLMDVVFSLLSDPTTAAPVSVTLSWLAGFVGWDVGPTKVEQAMRALSPVYALIVAHQRGHAARPYTIDPGATK